MESQVASQNELWISRQIIREYLAQCTRPQEFMRPMTSVQIREQMRSFRTLFQIADETEIVTEKLLDLVERFPTGGKQIHDANIVATMLVHDVPTLMTLNYADMKRFEPIIEIFPLSSQ